MRSYIMGAFTRVERFSRYSALAAKLEDPSFNWTELRAEFKRHNVDPDTFAVFERYNGGAIAYEFSLDIKEKNTNAAEVDFLSILTNGKVNLGLQASSDLLRGNKRTFRIVDNFEFLATAVPERYCAPSPDFPIHAHRNQKNFLYPITGSLRLAELIGAFLNLNQSGNLVGLDEPGKDLIPTISDTIGFTTKLTAGATPSIELTPVTNRFSLTKASLVNSNEREDFHQLRIIVKLPPEGPLVPMTIAERRAFDTIGGLPGQTLMAKRIKVLAVEELARQPDRELIEATIRFRERVRGFVVD